MCGIAGALNFELPAQSVMKLLKHRGPDEQKQWRDDHVHLIHTRLAIQELGPAGAQPMHLENLHIVFNGEIYNHQELRENYGLKCSSHSDTETLLHLFRLKGIDMLDDLDGMFAIAIYDDRASKLWLIRDRAGEKPLYYYTKGSTFIFASELGVLQTVVKPQVNDRSISGFLMTGYLPTNCTPYHDVHEIPPGSFAEINTTTGQYAVQQWWDMRHWYSQDQNVSFEEALQRTDALLRKSVQNRIDSSDLEVGAFLSGGIDSGLVTAMASKYNQKLKTFTVSFEGLYNEAPLAAKVAQHLGTHHHELQISFDTLETDLEKILSNYGEPIMDDSIIPSYYVSKEARKHITVVLNGDAGDELFGGYRRYVPFAAYDFFSGNMRNISGMVRSVLPVPSDKMTTYNYLYRLINLLAARGPSLYFSATNDLLHRHPDLFLVKPELQEHYDTINQIARLDVSALKRLMLLDATFLLPAVLLVKMDIATMAHSLEGRSPFLSRELLEFVPGLPDDHKIRKSRTKVLLRELAKKYLPSYVIDQPKRGFEVPLRSWVDTKIKTVINDHLRPEQAYVKQILCPGFINQLLDNKRKDIGPEQRAKVLFALLSVECWKKKLS